MLKNTRMTLATMGLTVCITAFAADDLPGTNTQQPSNAGQLQDKRLRISFRNVQFEARLHDNPTTRAFVSRLPLTLSMADIGNKEKYSAFADALPTDGGLLYHNAPGQLVYWPTGPGLAIYYKTDGKPVRGGIIVMAQIDAGLEKLPAADAGSITFEMIQTN